jgi:hypothetical protein
MRIEETSIAVERLGPHESRRIELFCPAKFRPIAVRWKVDRL